MSSALMSSNTVIQTCLETVSRLVPVTASAFYRVDNQLMPQQFVLHNMSVGIHRQYVESFQKIDPLRPANFLHADVNVIGINQLSQKMAQDYYQGFMRPNAIRDITEVFIRRQGRIVAGFSLLRDSLFTDMELGRLQDILPLIQLAAENLYSQELPLQLPLTEKERQIVGMLRDGASNKRIALSLGISLSTVKTHMRNIFAKTSVANRTELVTTLYMHS
ncbi:helix-turn-helix transcriptional regulator [Pectobacteriaceae bacterium CE70]|uniref:LuxR family transcriptional regulator n=1 Tax=Serratia sp. (strain ATCC 39006) TaxID=104623 RepID=A0A2I5TPC3_SERS3|nr:helix-turn-helix transcriptional regulator [Serratia sp. ATCC 39006]WJV63302.1 helix-turn-helix transcriptional regulator [Pectobacteriaceae bacterium C52]WJV67672.1 helix-turn-helix transcriptional regulator [Pectobacteriaceae bacterium CE70]WJY11614.1 helix-turn-helix transcriptional regulator [Pectobacteriaceae bacterium C80]AUH02091.1 LuxR family transcriptional regulator [Serratia sp. ATCC 39006]AUH06412.1 LuxR family transcriptional regulator [Serratia sp. ATCC 39006]